MWPSNIGTNPMKPPVTILTPTYNRRKFLPMLIKCIEGQTYPLERVEWLVYDDGTDPVWDILAPYEKKLNIRYFRSETKLTIGAKRNKLHTEARGEILVNMDDDDYYSPDRIRYAVNMLIASKLQIAGSSRNILYFTDDASIWEVGPFGSYHATFGTMVYTKKYALSHPCDETVAYAEEIKFTNRYTEPLVQLDPLKVMLVMCHKENTFSKNKLRTDGNPTMRKTTRKLREYIKDKEMRDFYMAA